jgi:hypothetical protein
MLVFKQLLTFLKATLSIYLPPSLSLSLSFFLSLTGQQGAHTLFTGKRESERGRDRESEKEERGERVKEGGIERVRKRRGERE